LNNFLHDVQPLFSTLLGLIRGVGVVDGSLETSSDVVDVGVTAGLGCRLDLSTILGVLKNLAGVLLGFLRCV
jgi:hypothetical protein